MTAGAALALRGHASPASRGLLRLSLASGAVAFPALVAIVVAMGLIANGYRGARDAAKESDEVLGQRLGQTRPIAAIWIGSIGLLVLLFLMVFKPF